MLVDSHRGHGSAGSGGGTLAMRACSVIEAGRLVGPVLETFVGVSGACCYLFSHKKRRQKMD